MKNFLIGLFVFISLPLLIATQIISILCASLQFVLEWTDFGVNWIFDWYHNLVSSRMNSTDSGYTASGTVHLKKKEEGGQE